MERNTKNLHIKTIYCAYCSYSLLKVELGRTFFSGFFLIKIDWSAFSTLLIITLIYILIIYALIFCINVLSVQCSTARCTLVLTSCYNAPWLIKKNKKTFVISSTSSNNTVFKIKVYIIMDAFFF